MVITLVHRAQVAVAVVAVTLFPASLLDGAAVVGAGAEETKVTPEPPETRAAPALRETPALLALRATPETRATHQLQTAYR